MAKPGEFIISEYLIFSHRISVNLRVTNLINTNNQHIFAGKTLPTLLSFSEGKK